MAIEIERRFLVKGDKWKDLAQNPQYLRQGYLATSIEYWTVRIRIIEENKAWITLKSPAEDISMHEFEYSIPLDDAESIWNLVQYKITKTRYKLNLKYGEWIIDCFHNHNSPLVIAEVELASSNEKIQIPNWCYQEITSNKKLSNAALALNPVSTWSEGSRRAIHL